MLSTSPMMNDVASLKKTSTMEQQINELDRALTLLRETCGHLANRLSPVSIIRPPQEQLKNPGQPQMPLSMIAGAMRDFKSRVDEINGNIVEIMNSLEI